MAGEALPYVQGESLKGSAAVLRRFVNSPVTSAAGDRSAARECRMDPSTYSIVADLLAKFQSSPEWIKALWLIAVPTMVVGVSRCVADVLKALIAAVAPRRSDPPLIDLPPPGEADAQWLASRNGELWLMRLPAPPLSPRGAAGEPGTHHRDTWE
jgi:hypothetical protein